MCAPDFFKCLDGFTFAARSSLRCNGRFVVSFGLVYEWWLVSLAMKVAGQTFPQEANTYGKTHLEHQCWKNQWFTCNLHLLLAFPRNSWQSQLWDLRTCAVAIPQKKDAERSWLAEACRAVRGTWQRGQARQLDAAKSIWQLYPWLCQGELG